MKKLNQKGALDMMLVAAVVIVLLVGGFVLMRISDSDSDDASNESVDVAETSDDIEVNQEEDSNDVDLPAEEDEAEEVEQTTYTASGEGEEFGDDTGQHTLITHGVTREVTDNGEATTDFIAFDLTIKNATDDKDITYSYEDFTLVNADGSEIRPSDGLGTTIVGPGSMDWGQVTLGPGENKRVTVFFYTADRGDSESGRVYWQPEGSTEVLEEAFNIPYSTDPADLEQ